MKQSIKTTITQLPGGGSITVSMPCKMSFEDFIYNKFPSFSHGHDWHHEEIDGLYYKREDYEKALDQYEDYCFKYDLKRGIK